ncbi:hypothetical protein E2C01_059914 [Portunus trituberculatus]|uniref:Uncharacterized protein n=1 Tax=Portunus trituberculatus TaxID=210409 RepID=A0A5B7H9Y7_PORTR|nr:hypothetical protein [Portunus trituberculatus]
MSTLSAAAQETSPPACSAITLERTGSLSGNSVSETELSHQREYENNARVHTGLTNPTTLSTSRQAVGDNSPGSSKQSGTQELTVTPRNEEWKSLPTFNEGSYADYWAFKRAFQSNVQEDVI